MELQTQTLEKSSPLAGIHPARLFAGSCLALISTAFAFSIITSSVGQYKESFALSNVDAGLIGGAAIWGFTIPIFILGPLCDALGMRLLLRVAFLFHFAGVVLMVFADYLGRRAGSPFGVLFAGALILSMGNGTVEAVCNPLVTSIYPDRKTVMLNRFHMWFPGGIAVGGLLALLIDRTFTGIFGGMVLAGKPLAVWQVKLALVLLPTIIYGILFTGQKFPATERVRSGISFGGMVKATLLRPLFIVLFLCMMITASLELGPGRWMSEAMEHAMSGLGTNAGILVLVWVNGLMAVLRLCAGPVVHRLSPTGILVCSAVLAGAGLYSLTCAESPVFVLIAATVFACGVCYFWPTMLGVASERVPKGGAMALGILGGTGMAVVGIVTVPLMGLIADHHVSATLQRDPVRACLTKFVDENSRSKLDLGSPLACTLKSAQADLEANPLSIDKSVGDLREVIKVAPDSDAGRAADALLKPVDQAGTLVSFRVVSAFAAVLIVAFGILYIRDRRSGGYRAEKSSARSVCGTAALGGIFAVAVAVHLRSLRNLRIAVAVAAVVCGTKRPNIMPENISLSVFFPCYNEEANVEPLTQKTRKVLESLVRDWEIILVNDGSKDHTGEVIDRLAAQDPRVRAVHHAKNGGYGAALKTGFRSATKQYVFFTDGDGQFDVAEIALLLARRGEADIVCGIRRHRQDTLIRKINSACWAFFVQRMLGFRCPDVDCAFKLFKREVLDHIELKSNGALISAELLARAAHLGYATVSLPVTHLPRQAGAATGAKLSVIFKAFGELWKLRKDIRSTKAGSVPNLERK